MTWNHRVMVHIPALGEEYKWYGIHEVFYDPEGRPDGNSYLATRVVGDSVDDLRETLTRMLKCLDHPVLTESDCDAEQNIDKPVEGPHGITQKDCSVGSQEAIERTEGRIV